MTRHAQTTAREVTLRTFRLPDPIWEGLAAIARRERLYVREGDETSGLNRTAALVLAVEQAQSRSRVRKPRKQETSR